MSSPRTFTVAEKREAIAQAIQVGVSATSQVDFAAVRYSARRLHTTRSVLDLADRVVEVHDARELGYATWEHAYDYAGNRLKSAHATALGTRYALSDAAGSPIWSRDALGVEVHRTFDALQRPLTEASDDGGGAGLKLRRAWVHTSYDRVNDANNDAGRAANRFGQVEEERDADGLRVFTYDWRGQPTAVEHRFWDLDWQGDALWGEHDLDPVIPPTTQGRDDAGLAYLAIPQRNRPIYPHSHVPPSRVSLCVEEVIHARPHIRPRSPQSRHALA